MQVLLINQNATIERLVSLSTGKLLYTLDKIPTADDAESKDYDFIIIDSDLYDEDSFAALKGNALGATTIMMLSKGFERPNGIDIFIEKPFLPTELVDILSTARTSEPLESPMSTMSSMSNGFDDEIPSLDDIESSHAAKDDDAVVELDDLEALDDLDGHTTAQSDIAEEISLDDMADDMSVGEDEIHLDGIDIATTEDEMPNIDENDTINLDDLGLDSGEADVKEEEGLGEDIDLGGLEDEIKLDEVDTSGDSSDELNLDDLGLDGLDMSMDDENATEEVAGEGAEIAIEPEAEDAKSLDELDLDMDFGDMGAEEPEMSSEVEIQDETKDEIADLDADLDLGELGLESDDDSEAEGEDEKPAPKDERLADFDALDDDMLEGLASLEEAREESPLPELDLDALGSEANEDSEDEEQSSASAVPSSIFGDDEVQKLKDLLGEEDEENAQEAGETDAPEESMSIQNDEFASITEESVADALGIDYNSDDNGDLEDIGLENLDEPEAVNLPAVTPSSQGGAVSTIQMSGADLLSMPIERIKELLEAADITINITLSKKQ